MGALALHSRRGGGNLGVLRKIGSACEASFLLGAYFL